jgi:hypothetical protein
MNNAYLDLTRDELYALVWSKPTSELAQEFNVSDVAIAKRCQRMNIPKPPPGYWQQLRAGQKPKRRALPPAGQKPQTRQVRRRAKPPPFAGVPEEQRVCVLDHLEKPHPMIRAAQRALEKGNVDTYGWLQPTWPDRCPLDMRVSKGSLDRALRLLDALLKAIQRHGYDMEENESSMILVDGERVRLRFKEKTTKKKRELTRAEQALPIWQQPSSNIYTPSGQFVILLELPSTYGFSSFQTWQDGENQPLEYRLHEILKVLPNARDTSIAQRKAQAEAERHRQEEQRRRWEIERRQREEQQRFEVLEKQAALWVRSQNLRAFLEACEQKLMLTSAGGTREVTWLKWALRWIDQLDPLENGQVEALVAHHPETDTPSDAKKL